MRVTADDMRHVNHKLGARLKELSPADRVAAIRIAMDYGYQKAKDELEAEYAAKHAAYARKVTDRLIDGEITVKFRPVFEVETS